MSRYHISHCGDIEFCGQSGFCLNEFGHFLSPQSAIEERNRLASQGRLYLTGVAGGHGGDK